jgi:hypothetical protein
MTTTPPIIDQAEQFVRELAEELIRVRDGECLCCYVARQVEQLGCDGTHRHAFAYRDSKAPRATALGDKLSRIGACCCDCELFMNAYALQLRFWTPGREVEDEDGFVTYIEAKQPDELPPCAGVRRGSIQPCGNWERMRRW